MAPQASNYLSQIETGISALKALKSIAEDYNYTEINFSDVIDVWQKRDDYWRDKITTKPEELKPDDIDTLKKYTTMIKDDVNDYRQKMMRDLDISIPSLQNLAQRVGIPKPPKPKKTS